MFTRPNYELNWGFRSRLKSTLFCFILLLYNLLFNQKCKRLKKKKECKHGVCFHKGLKMIWKTQNSIPLQAQKIKSPKSSSRILLRAAQMLWP